MRECPKCGKISVGENFCKNCGTQLWVKCTGCGQLLWVEDGFCGNCGTKNTQKIS